MIHKLCVCVICHSIRNADTHNIKLSLLPPLPPPPPPPPLCFLSPSVSLPSPSQRPSPSLISLTHSLARSLFSLSLSLSLSLFCLSFYLCMYFNLTQHCVAQRILRGHRRSSQKPSESNKIRSTWNPLPSRNKQKFALQASTLRLMCIQNTIWSRRCNFFENPHPSKQILFVSLGFCEVSQWLHTGLVQKHRLATGSSRLFVFEPNGAEAWRWCLLPPTLFSPAAAPAPTVPLGGALFDRWRPKYVVGVGNFWTKSKANNASTFLLQETVSKNYRYTTVCLHSNIMIPLFFLASIYFTRMAR